MHHEHHSGCGHVPDDAQLHEAHEHTYHHAEHLGACAVGACVHPEHQAAQLAAELQGFMTSQLILESAADKSEQPKDKTKVKAKEKDNKRSNKKPHYFQLGRLSAKAA
jgi:hypothetical protein